MANTGQAMPTSCKTSALTYYAIIIKMFL